MARWSAITAPTGPPSPSRSLHRGAASRRWGGRRRCFDLKRRATLAAWVALRQPTLRWRRPQQAPRRYSATLSRSFEIPSSSLTPFRRLPYHDFLFGDVSREGSAVRRDARSLARLGAGRVGTQWRPQRRAKRVHRHWHCALGLTDHLADRFRLLANATKGVRKWRAAGRRLSTPGRMATLTRLAST